MFITILEFKQYMYEYDWKYDTVPIIPTQLDVVILTKLIKNIVDEEYEAKEPVTYRSYLYLSKSQTPFPMSRLPVLH